VSWRTEDRGRADEGAAGRQASALPPALALLVGLATSVADWGTPAAASPAAVDCFADRVVEFRSAFADPAAGFGFANLPGIVLGPPGDSAATTGSVSVVSLGRGGSITVEFSDNVIVDGAGPDLIVFENGFFRGSVPASPDQDYSVAADLARVQASADGVHFFEFPFSEEALARVQGDTISKTLALELVGLAGITPTFTGNWTVPDDPFLWDASGVGGISGAGGDAYDLARVGLAEARFVRIIDSGAPTGFAGPSEGFDLDAVVALNGRPAAPAVGDADGDGLDDLAETLFYGSRPDDPDSDGDGVEDGAEVAGCRSPAGASQAPFFSPRLDLRAENPAATLLRWNFLGTPYRYDAARGEISSLRFAGDSVDLGLITCIEDDSPDLHTGGREDAEIPDPGRAFFYVGRAVRAGAITDWGHSSDGRERIGAGGCP
jgi:hypothetical protein